MPTTQLPKDDLPPFMSAEHLLNTARERLADFGSASDKFLTRNQPNLVHRVDAETAENVYYLHFPSSVPLNLRRIACETANDTRHALDHAFGDAAIEAGRPDAKGIHFPVGRSVENFEAQIRRCCGGVHPTLVDFCRALEPYERGKSGILWALSRLSARCKHGRIVHLIQCVDAILYPKEETFFTGPMYFSPVWTENAGEVEFGRGAGEIHGELRFHTRITVNTTAAGFSVHGQASLSDCVQAAQRVVAGLKAEVARLKGTRA